MTTTTLKPLFPASAAGRGTLLQRALGTLRAWHARARQRRHLAELSPHLLEDLGLKPEAARAEAAKPFWRA